MDICCITGYGKRVRKENGLIVIDPAVSEANQVPKTVVSPADLSLMLITGDHSLSTAAVRTLLEQGTELVLLDPHGAPSGYLLPCRMSPITEHTVKQRNLSPKKALAIAKEIVRQAIRNKSAILQGIRKNRAGIGSGIFISLEDYGNRAETAGSVAVLLGIEGAATREYYAALSALIPKPFGFHGRTRHPPRDPTNALLSYGYGILYAVIRTALVKVKLSPFYGVLHADYRRQEPLVYDFIEEFRQPVVDRVVLTMINHRQVDPGQFSISEAGCLIPPALKKVLAEAVLGRLDAKFEYKGQPQPFSAVIDGQAQLLADALLNGKSYSPFAYR
jgi:CRISPR-associated protein Cas1